MSNAGRPPKFNNPEEMQSVINAYFDKCKPEFEKDQEGKILTNTKGFPIIKLNPPTITGLALALGFSSRGTIYEYEKKNDEFSDTVKLARLKCENWVEEQSFSGVVPPAVGIFALKNYGWRDNIEITGDEKKELYPTKIIINGIKSSDTGQITPDIPNK